MLQPLPMELIYSKGRPSKALVQLRTRTPLLESTTRPRRNPLERLAQAGNPTWNASSHEYR